MDAINLQGVFLQYPEIVSSGKLTVAAGILHRMIAMRRSFDKYQDWNEVPERKRRRLLDRTLEKLAKMDEDDLFLVLSS